MSPPNPSPVDAPRALSADVLAIAISAAIAIAVLLGVLPTVPW